MAGESTGARARGGGRATPLPGEVLEHEGSSDLDAARVLGTLPFDEWRVFHHVRRPGRRMLRLDHVVVGPSGVFVIDDQAWDGDITIERGVLRQDGRRRDRFSAAVADAAVAVRALLPHIEKPAIHPVLCLNRDEPVFGWSGSVMICSTANLASFLLSRPKWHTESEAREIATTLSRSLSASTATRAPTSALPPGISPVDTEGRPLHTEEVPDLRPVRAARAPVSRQVRALALLGAVVATTALVAKIELHDRVADLSARATERVISRTEPIGTAIPVPAYGTTRPPLSIAAGKPVFTKPKIRGLKVERGHRLVAVPLTVRNTGGINWTSRADLVTLLADDAGLTYSADPAFAKVTAGRSLPPDLTVPPGSTRRGMVVFEMPREARVARVTARVGPGLPKTLRWSIG